MVALNNAIPFTYLISGCRLILLMRGNLTRAFWLNLSNRFYLHNQDSDETCQHSCKRAFWSERLGRKWFSMCKARTGRLACQCAHQKDCLQRKSLAGLHFGNLRGSFCSEGLVSDCWFKGHCQSQPFWCGPDSLGLVGQQKPGRSRLLDGRWRHQRRSDRRLL